MSNSNIDPKVLKALQQRQEAAFAPFNMSRPQPLAERVRDLIREIAQIRRCDCLRPGDSSCWTCRADAVLREM